MSLEKSYKNLYKSLYTVLATLVAIATFSSPARADGQAPAPTQDLPPPPAAPIVEQMPPASTALVPSMGSHYRLANTWNADIDLGTGALFGDTKPHSYFFDVRGGALFIRDSLFYSVNLACEWATPEPANIGLQAEVLSLGTGLWGDVGGSIDAHGNPGAMLSAGFSVFGVEAEYRAYPGIRAEWAVYAKLRIPVGIIFYALFNGPGSTH